MVIVPARKLIIWFGVTVLPFALAAGLVAETRVLSVAIMAVASLIFAGDAILAPLRFRGLRIELPEAAICMTLGREGVLRIRVGCEEKRVPKVLHLGLALPRGLSAREPVVRVQLPADADWFTVVYSIDATQRGRYTLSRCYAEISSPLGFWQARKAFASSCEVRVYPDLMRDGRDVSALFLTRGSVGMHAQRQVGRGKEFERLREYAPGDNYDEIYWKATARRGAPITKVFQIERTQEVYVIVDTSRMSARLSGGVGNDSVAARTLLDRYIASALILGLAAEKQGDLFGLLTFSDRVHTFVRARHGRRHYGVCRDALYTLTPSMVSPDFSELFSFIRLRLRRRALLVFLTSLDDRAVAEQFTQDLGMICRHHVVLVAMARPATAVPLFAGDAPVTDDDVYARLGGHVLWEQLMQLQRALEKHSVRLSLVDADTLAGETVTRYMNVKQRQLV
ncbi:MAG: DUF58 domain-containing protein [Candidatus Pacebacteria bacterium]|nr:DUF58 domain-containing protein [Candidatus Paceibacterota bacterium]